MKHNALKNLLTNNKNVMRALHTGFGFDFEADMLVVHLGEPFTANKIAKILRADGYDTTREFVTAVLVKDPRRENVYRYARLQLGSFDVTRIKGMYFDTGLDNWIRKGDFEAERKKTTDAFVISQRAELVKLPTAGKYTPGAWDRFKMVGHSRIGDGRGTTWEYYRADLKKLLGTGDCIEYKLRAYTNDAGDFIDKSGYLVEDHRADLKRRAAALRADRERAEYMAADYSADIKKMLNAAQAMKNEAAAALASVTDPADVKALADIIDRYTGVYGVYATAFDVADRDENKKFSSVESATTAIAKLMDAIGALRARISDVVRVDAAA